MSLPTLIQSQFWQFDPSDSPALFEDGAAISRRQLLSRVDQFAGLLAEWEEKSFGFLSFTSTCEAVAAYLACLRSGRAAPLLLNPATDPRIRQSVADHYRPDWSLVAADAGVLTGYAPFASFGGMRLDKRTSADASPTPHQDLALLLATSGSTGSAKLVRLSYAALSANTSSIVSYLGLQAEDRTISTLPFAYSFGMSVLNTHLACGGAIALSTDSLLSREFWSTAAAIGTTNLSGVPSSFDMLRRVGLEKRGLTRLRFLAQAGGAMRADLINFFDELGRRHGWSLFVMYGQTEAGPRISYVPPERLSQKLGSIGIPIPGGTLDIDAQSGELIYRGPNVMMGYAEERADLARGDECAGVLATGDLARRDDEGFFYLTGRKKRFVKLSGVRISLDSVEQQLEQWLQARVACTGRDDHLVIWLANPSGTASEPELRALLRDRFDIFPGHVRVNWLDNLPVNANGKIDYHVLNTRSEGL